MKLPPLTRDKDIWLKEFDHWVTPYLEEIRDSAIFFKTIKNIKTAIELLGTENDGFNTEDAALPNHIVDAAMMGLNASKDPQESYALITSFCDFLFLITGKTDNNFKCQFPVYLKEYLKWNKYPYVRGNELTDTEVPRVIQSSSIATLISRLENIKQKCDEGNLAGLKKIDSIIQGQTKLLFSYFQYILNKEIYSRSLKVFGLQYFELKQDGNEDDLLAPLIISYVRGSASATGGHKPEEILRTHMNSWGLKASEDYNTKDVNPFVSSTNSGKTRAYDFVLPFNVKNWGNKIFIQSQFYAGDSGSVSHKNVDQTSNSRLSLKSHVQDTKFVEYVDGAGYYGSLNGDLKSILQMGDTYNFFQVKTFPIKLRQLFQDIGFLTPLELVHSLVINNFDIIDSKKGLEQDGYDLDEIERVIENTFKEGIIKQPDKAEISIDETFYKLSRKYFLLDSIAIFGNNVDILNKGQMLVPGYGEFFGAKTSEVLDKMNGKGGNYYNDWQNPQTFIQDIEFLLENKWVIYNG